MCDDKPTQNLYVSFYQIFGKVIPCCKCAQHYDALLATYPLNAPSSRDDLFAWTVEIHNQMNTYLGKQCITLEEAKTKYLSPLTNSNQ